MNRGQTIFSQVMKFFPHREVATCVAHYGGERYVKTFSCMDQFLCMAFAQLAYRESLRDIECCLRAHPSKLYHMGIRGKVSRSTLADANENRDWRIYRDFAQILIAEAKELYINDHVKLQLEETVYILDATIIDQCLSLFPWVDFWRTKAAIKLHTLLDLQGNIPSFIAVTDAEFREVNI